MVQGAAIAVPHGSVHRQRARRRALRRRRAALRVLAVCCLALSMVLALPRVVRVMARPAVEPTPVYVTVKQGDTLWAIATRYAQGRDVRKVVWEIQRENGLDGGWLYPGMVLTIPVSK